MINIPQEIISFLNKKGGQTLLIKGRIGSGKTSLSCSLIKARGKNGIYISTRVRPDDLYQNFPWITDQLSRENILNASNFPSREEIAVENRDISQVLKYGSKEDFLVTLYERVADLSNPVVVIDTWNDVLTELNTSEKLMWKVVIKLCGETETDLILVVDQPEESQLDYLVDGIVNLEETQVGDRLLRTIQLAKLKGIKIRRRKYFFSLQHGEFRSFEYDIFICHAWGDKETIARPLAHALMRAGLIVWYDEFTLKIGDSLRRSIDHGLSQSRYGVVILSPHFFAREWPQRELDGLVAREVSSEKVILPVWHEVTREDIERFSPVLADRLGVSTSDGLDTVLQELLRVVRPEEAEEFQESSRFMKKDSKRKKDLEVKHAEPSIVKDEIKAKALAAHDYFPGD